MKEIFCTDVTISAIRRDVVRINHCENCNRHFTVTQYEQKEDASFHYVYFRSADYCPFCGFHNEGDQDEKTGE